ncbi:Ribokinase-like protein [Podospora appendiculata]|uniref:Ribokinase-like protein n=1 Tax=Podospora appendiculata TaxID=314037 RepID=A0AAE0X6S3_9PEZI|nr:Ribokinase-like protein [Podospora appendiculata]
MEPGKKTVHLVMVGACYLDTILTVPHFPDEDAKLRATALQVRRGGNCPNALEVLQQLLSASTSNQQQQQQQQQQQHQPMVKPHLVTCLPHEQATATRTILESFGARTIVDFSQCLFRDGYNEAASSYILRSKSTGSRTIVNFNELPEITAHEFEKTASDLVAEHGGDESEFWWHFEGRIPETTLHCIRYIRRLLPGSTVSVEVEKPDREGLVELAAESDVVFYSRSWAEVSQLLGCAMQYCVHFDDAGQPYRSLLACTWGAQGAGAFSVRGREFTQCPANPSGDDISVVDTIGAGDTFIAGMVYGLICHTHDWSLEAKLAFAVSLSTAKVQREGFAGLASTVLGT